MRLGLGLGLQRSRASAFVGAALDLMFAGAAKLDPRITFSRTSNATLTNSAGVLTYAPHNLLTFSEQFDNAAWSKINATISANSTEAPNGTATADKLVANNGIAGYVEQSTSYTAGMTYVWSFYAKAAERNSVMFLVYGTNFGGSNIGRTFTLTGDGSVGSLSGTVPPTAATITPVGNGCYRCTLTAVCVITHTGASFQIRDAVVGDGVSGRFIWGAQLNVGALQPYYPTTVKNLLGYTEHFDNAAWTKSNATIASGFTDIYGQPFAQKLVEDTENAGHLVYGTATVVTGNLYTYSAYIKRAERRYALMAVVTAFPTTAIQIDLDTGGVSTGTGSPLNAFAVSMGNGWYRCGFSIAATATAGQFNIYASSTGLWANRVYTGDGTSGIYIFGAQLSDSASVDPYVYNPVAAPTAQAYYGPRFDYDPVTLAPKGLLIEEQRSNLLLNSATLSTQVVTVAATAHTLSFYGNGTIVLSGASTGTVVGTGAYPTRTTFTFTPTVGVLTVTVTGSVTMAQLEAGAFATSYIPTVASQVTRAADNASMIGNNFARWFTQGVGTVFADSLQANNGANTLALNSAGTNIIRLGGGKMDVFVAGTSVAQITGTATTGSIKQAGAYQVNDFAISANGGVVSTDTSGGVPFVDSMVFQNAVGSYLNGTIKRIAYYNRRLSNTELQGVTS